jgi:hypothetical protein
MLPSLDCMVAVGTRIAPRPPHRSRRALLTHRAPPSGSGAEAMPRLRMQYLDWRSEAVGHAGGTVAIALTIEKNLRQVLMLPPLFCSPKHWAFRVRKWTSLIIYPRVSWNFIPMNIDFIATSPISCQQDVSTLRGALMPPSSGHGGVGSHSQFAP